MQMNDQAMRQAALKELGLGPLWLLRQADVAMAMPEHAAVLFADATVSLPVPVSVPGIEAVPELVKELSPSTPVASVPEAVAAWADVPELTTTSAPTSTAEAVWADESAQPSVIVQQAIAQQPAEQVQQLPQIASMSWEDLQPMVETCRQCGLCQGRKKAVFGTGDKQAKWLFVGEGPGYNENLQGLPFVGAAGQLLDNMLKALGVQRGDQAYIANIVKCRPTDEMGKDRPPTADEVAACLPYLHRQIALIQPQVIVALGKTATVSLLGLDMETPVGQLRGKVHRFQGIPVVATYHPAYLLRKPADKNKAWIDLCMARAAMTAGAVPAH